MTSQQEIDENVDHFENLLMTLRSITLKDVFKFYNYAKSIDELQLHHEKLDKIVDLLFDVTIYDMIAPRSKVLRSIAALNRISPQKTEIMEIIQSVSDEDIKSVFYILCNAERLREYTEKTNTDCTNILNLITEIKEEEKNMCVADLITHKNKFSSEEISLSVNTYDTDDTYYSYVRDKFYKLGFVPVAIVGGTIGAIFGAVGGAVSGAFKGERTAKKFYCDTIK